MLHCDGVDNDSVAPRKNTDTNTALPVFTHPAATVGFGDAAASSESQMAPAATVGGCDAAALLLLATAVKEVTPQRLRNVDL